MKEKILEWCRTLATSQGFYGRLLEEFEEHPEKLEKVAKNDFKDVVDFVMFIES
jgi:hypothetical protein